MNTQKKTYVTLVSDQAVPNVQYIKEFSNQIATFLFVSTTRMEAMHMHKSKNIVDACKIPNDLYSIIKVDEENLSSIISELENALKDPIFKDTSGFIVNCTLGTKIMAIGLYDFFKVNEKAILLYTPIGTNRYRGIIDQTINQSFITKLSVEEYIKSYGIGIQSVGKPLYSNLEFTNKYFTKHLNIDHTSVEILERLRSDKNQIYRKNGVADFALIAGLDTFLKEIDFPAIKKESLTKYEVKYLTGGWFEEWVFYKLKEILNLGEDEIVIGLNTKLEAQNDLDVVLMFQNSIHIIECKTAIPENQLQQAVLYKSGALVDKFGRNAFSYLFTLSNLRDSQGDIKQSIKDRALQQKVTVADRKTLSDSFNQFIHQHFTPDAIKFK